MKIPLEKISSADSLQQLGIDSLIAMELQMVLQQELCVRLSTLDLMKGSSLQQMSEHICKLLLDMSVDGIDASEGEQINTHDITKNSASNPVDDLDDDQVENLLNEIIVA